MINNSDVNITPMMLKMIAEVDAFKGSWSGFSGEISPVQLKTLKRVATIESVGSSNRIEGNRLSDEEINTLFNHIKRTSFVDRDEAEVAGYRDLLNIIFESYEDIPLSENYIKQLHGILLHYLEQAEYFRGEYKTDSNKVALFKNGKVVATVFETATPFDTPRLMTELVDWTNKNLADGYFHPLLVIGIFLLHFLAIHPFTDGNGRISRALTVLLMLRCGYHYMPYSSMESIIEASKENYYAAIRSSQRNIWTGNVNYEPWLTFFLTGVVKQKRHLEEKIKNLDSGNRLGLLADRVLKLFDVKDSWTIGEMNEELQVNKETLKKTVQLLVKENQITKHGLTKGAWYSK